MNRRRDLLVLLGAAALAPGTVRAQAKPPAGRVWRIGFFYNGSRRTAMDTGRFPAFLQGMRELGYVEGKDFVVEARFVPELRLLAPAVELVQANVDVIVSSGGAAVSALKQANSAIPVVFATTIDPVRGGYAASFARPGGNFTGLSAQTG